MNLMAVNENQLNIYFALKNPLRCWIMELLASNEDLSSSDLANLLHISLGRCCYHLDNLGGLVKKDNQNHYFLSKKGQIAVQLLRGHI